MDDAEHTGEPSRDTAGVTVCFASYNTKAVTELCVRSMRATAGAPFTLWAGDCGSTDGSRELLERFARDGWLDLEVAPDGRTHPEWLDQWHRACPTRYLVFSDSDVEYRRNGWLTEMLAAARNADAALVATRIQAKDGVPYTNPVTGAHAILAARPEPWLMLIDVTKTRPTVATSFAYTEERREDGALVAFDTAAAFFRALDAAGLPWVEMPPSFASAYRHYGSMTWQRGAAGSAMPRSRQLKQLAKRALVAVRLPLARRRR